MWVETGSTLAIPIGRRRLLRGANVRWASSGSDRTGPGGATVQVMTQRIWAATAIVLASAATACSDDDGDGGLPDVETNSPYTRAIVESTSHDEIILPGGGDMVVAVNCNPEDGGLPVVTAVADGLDNGLYVGEFDPSTGVDISLQVNGPGDAVASAQMALDDEAYVVTFSSIEGGQFDVDGC